MAIRAKGSGAEYVFTRLVRPGYVDAMSLETGERFQCIAISRFKAGGGTNEIIREVKMLQEMTEGRKNNDTF